VGQVQLKKSSAAEFCFWARAEQENPRELGELLWEMDEGFGIRHIELPGYWPAPLAKSLRGSFVGDSQRAYVTKL
jgi:hypothetical protein